MLTRVFRLKCDPPSQRSWGAERGRLGLRSVGCIGRRGWRCGRLPGTCRSGKNTVKRALGAQGPPRYVRSPLGSAVDEFEPAILGLLVEFPSMPTSVFVERVGWTRGKTVFFEGSRRCGRCSSYRTRRRGSTTKRVSWRNAICGSRRWTSRRLGAGGPAAGIGKLFHHKPLPANGRPSPAKSQDSPCQGQQQHTRTHQDGVRCGGGAAAAGVC